MRAMKKPRVFEFVRDLRVDLSRWRTLAQAYSDSMVIFDQTTDFALFQRLPSVASLPVSVDVLALRRLSLGGMCLTTGLVYLLFISYIPLILVCSGV